MDIIETIDAIFENTLHHLIENKSAQDVATFTRIIMEAKRSVMLASASNPLNTEYILASITPYDYDAQI